MALNRLRQIFSVRSSMPMHDKGSGCKRPLPPPESREAVLDQIGKVTNWTVFGDLDDVYIAVPRKKAKIDKRSPICEYSLPSSYNVTDIRHNEIQNGNYFANGGSTTFDFDQPHSASLAIPTSTQTAAQQMIETELEEARRLAKATEAVDFASDKEDTGSSPTQPKLKPSRSTRNDIAREKLESAGQERSRELRRQALARQTLLNEEFGVSILSKASDQRRDLCHREHEDCGHPSTASQEVQSREPGVSNKSSEATSHLRQSPVSDIDHDHLFGFVEYTSDMASSAANNEHKCSATSSQDQSLYQPHPASRAAAEKYRTQDRHLAKQSNDSGLDAKRAGDLEQNEKRLLLLKSQIFQRDSSPQCHPQDQGQATGEIDDQANEASQATTLISQTSSSVEELLKANFYSQLSTTDGVLQNESFEVSLSSHDRGQTSLPQQRRSSPTAIQYPPFPPLHARCQRKQTSPRPQEPKSSSRSKALTASGLYPAEPSDLTLPKSFDYYDYELQNVVKEAERCKEQARDLEIIIPCFENIAQYGALNQFSDVESAEVSTAQEYVQAVVVEGLSGKKVRRRLSDIRANMQRRIQRLPPGEDREHQALLNKLLPKERHEHIQQLIKDLHVKIEYLRVQRGEARNKRHRKKVKKASCLRKPEMLKKKLKQVRFALDESSNSPQASSSISDGKDDTTDANEAPEDLHLSFREKCRLAQYAAADKKMALLQNRLALFNQSPEPDIVQDGESSQEAQKYDEGSAGSASSEEEEGAELFSVDLNMTSQPLESDKCIAQEPKPNNTEGDEHKNCETVEVQSSELSPLYTAHDGLSPFMEQREKQRAIPEQHDTSVEEGNLLRVDDEQEHRVDAGSTKVDCKATTNFEDIDGDEFSDNDCHACYRYVLKAQFANVQDHENGCEYTLGTFIDVTKANQEQDRIVEGLREQYCRNRMPGEHPNIREQFSEESDLRIRSIELGHAMQVSCYSWIKKEEFSPNKEAYQNAKIRRACRARPIYIVLWKRVVTPVPLGKDDAHTSQTDAIVLTRENGGCTIAASSKPEGDTASHDRDDLFGPSPSPVLPTQCLESSTTATPDTVVPFKVASINLDGLRFFSDIANANRHAKHVFMTWYMDHLPGQENWRDIAQMEYCLEAELESYGNWTMWQREEEFYVCAGLDTEDVSGREVQESVTSNASDLFFNDDTTTVDHSSQPQQQQQQQQQQQHIFEKDRFKVWVEMRPVSGPAN